LTVLSTCQTKINKVGEIVLKRPVIDEIDLTITNAMNLNASTNLRKIGEAKELAIMFTDIVSYTPFAEALPPYDIIHVLNRYFYLMGKVISKHQGNIIDYYGDGILAVFGLYAEKPKDGALLAVSAGMDMQKELGKLNPYLEKMYGKSFKVRIGINYGSVVTGSVGIDSMQKFAVIGDAVNMASRIETANKEFGTNFLIAESVKNLLPPEVSLGEKFQVKLKGKKGNYTLYEVLTPHFNN
jgi:adenylate cyclase